jgi:hypothetical protein
VDNFLAKLEAFHEEFDIDTTPEGRVVKFAEEFCEFLDAFYNSTKEHADEEAIDALVCAIANCKARGLNNILFLAEMKLEKTAEKYRKQGRKRV